ncbi:alanine racemase [Gluconobacter thailandicus F149-1 = NBRC 100600]|uniref:Alanine racemase n=1 Tax=Gluconobacter thailandicus NBRC 3257 TaxID=1381097 RepID=A0ABQ0IWH1_GLUTH|nr:alanine racemase [Gluconobacter thailandicus]GAN91345.1 alanine racemase [Gluconobacter frateurii M-2]KXV52722.1 alanine racemase [Gluconobacter thailandicus]GAC87875.1 alanine racemase [Gluconobacter thailandicus NBRC 3255]GAD26544.1 alanine racemase [Gluconobacter thailandicus NBRC 3257]GAN92666.1 alanine racemase [Gluconobacter thailandicus F149-1 = NBRC 100600]
MTILSGPHLWPASRAGATLTVDLAAIADNYRLLCGKVNAAVCAAVVKADAYGLGAEQVAPVLERAGAREFFVAHVDEGIALRKIVSAETRITVLHGPRPDAAAECVYFDLRPVLNSLDQVDLWKREALRQQSPLDAVLQVDSGMSRFGLSRKDVGDLADDPERLGGIRTNLIMSHLACADDPANPANEMQRQRFLEMAAMLPPAPLSLSASSGIFLGSAYHMGLVRPGAALYGIAPNTEAANPLKQVVRLQARVLQLRNVDVGEGVGYGLTYQPEGPRRIATVAVGYADGFSRQNGGTGCAWFGDIRLPIVGRVSMDSLALDVSAVPEALLHADMHVDLIGARRSVDDVAAAAGTIGYEILTSLGGRYYREYTE